jgi:uncharacterized protein
MRRIAVIGSGIAGLAVAHGLRAQARVTLFEAGDYFGGHTHTVDITLGGVTHGVDTGFLVLNERTYPRLLRLFDQLGVEIARSDMSFSVQVPDIDLEWSGSDLNTVFAQRRNLLRPRFWRMLSDLLRFNRLATELACSDRIAELDQPIGEFLKQHRFSDEFRDWYFLPMIGCIWSCPTGEMLRFPVATMIRFCHNHGLIQVANRPQWYTVRGGARNYVRKMLEAVPDARLNTPVRSVRRPRSGDADQAVLVSTDAGTERFDEVVMACHSDQVLALLTDASADESSVLGAIRYHRNRAVLHTDASVLPKRPLAWAAWNYERAAQGSRERATVCLHYLLNRLQPLPFDTPVLVSLNPVHDPRSDWVYGEFAYAHPVFDAAAIEAQQRVPAGPTPHLVLRRLDTLRLSRRRPDVGPGGLRGPGGALGRRAGARSAGGGVIGAAALTALIGTGEVRHTRVRPARNSFVYPTYFLMLPMRSLRASPCPDLPRNRFGLISFFDRDHGDGRSDSLAWLEELLAREGVRDADGEVWLHCYPRVLGFTFKPVSFWYCHRVDNSLAAVVVEVNNTFGERHCYLLGGPDLAFGRELSAAKVFHVSPFCAVAGSYRFRFMRNDLHPVGASIRMSGSMGISRTIARVDHHDDQGLLIQTSVSGELRPLTSARLRAAFFGMPLMTLGVIGRIHWQAWKLWRKRVPFFRKPAPPTRFTTR